MWRHFEENGLIANVWTMKPDGTDKKQITDFGSMSWAPYEHPSGEYFLFASNKLGFENFEVFMVDKAGLERTGAHHVFRRLRWPAGAVSGRHAGRVHVEPRRRRRRGGTDLSRAVESPGRDGGVEGGRAATDSCQEIDVNHGVTKNEARNANALHKDTYSRDRCGVACSRLLPLFPRPPHRLARERMWKRWRRRRWRDASRDRPAKSSRRII